MDIYSPRLVTADRIWRFSMTCLLLRKSSLNFEFKSYLPILKQGSYNFTVLSFTRKTKYEMFGKACSFLEIWNSYLPLWNLFDICHHALNVSLKTQCSHTCGLPESLKKIISYLMCLLLAACFQVAWWQLMLNPNEPSLSITFRTPRCSRLSLCVCCQWSAGGAQFKVKQNWKWLGWKKGWRERKRRG